jgi:hypothetical protein
VTAGATGSGVGTVAVQVSVNTGNNSRSATLSIGGGSPQLITLTQAGNGCTYSLNYNSAVPTSGGSVPVQLTTGSTCDWNILNDAPSAVTLNSGATSPGSGTINLTVAANPNQNARSLRLYIADNYVSLVQSGQCSFSVTPPGTILWSGGSVTIPVSTTSGCTWTSSSNVSWASVSGSPGTTGSGSVTFTIARNPAGPGPRTGTVTVAGQTITLTQTPPASNVGVFRQGFLWLLDLDGNERENVPPDLVYAFGGIAGDIPIVGDWNGDGHSKIGIYRPLNGLFILDTNGDGVLDTGDQVFSFAGAGNVAGDIPVVGDWNGDGRSKVGLFRQGFLWILDVNGNGVLDTANGDKVFAFGGVTGDVPIVGDWTGTGVSKPGLVRQGFLWILDINDSYVTGINPGQGQVVFPYGGYTGDVPLVGDWNGTGTSQVGVFRQGFLWVLDAGGHRAIDASDLVFAYGGLSGDKPVLGRW